jgi:hypothetical protein
MNCFVAAFKPILYKWEQHAIFFIVAVEKRAHVSRLMQLRASEGYGCRG